MTTVKDKDIKVPSRMAEWFFARGLKYARLARAIPIPRTTQSGTRPWTRQDIQSIAHGIVPSEAEKLAIIKGLQALGYRALPGDLW